MVKPILFSILLSLFANLAWAADIVATLDRNPVAVNESFTVMFDATGDVDDDPDFSPLETFFDILNQTQSSRVQIINGRMDSTKQWQLILMAREPGTYTLPAIAFGRDQSNPLELEVREAPASSASPDSTIFLEAEVSPQSAYVQAQLVYTVRLLRSVNLRSASLSEPEISGVDAIVEKLGEDRSFEATRNGASYAVVERSYAIFPQHSGTLSIEPTIFQGQIVTRSSRFLLDEEMQIKRLISKPFSVEVKPKPATAATPWLPARALRLQEEWAETPPQFKVGEPITRTLTLAADGITAAQLPSLTDSLPDGLKQYPDQPVLQDDKRSTGVFGMRQEKIAIMPSRPGRYELPAIEVPWWNVETGQQEVARIPARSIEVAAASDAASAPPAPLPSVPVDTTPAAAAPSGIAQTTAGFWPWISGTLALGWLLSGLLWWRQHRTTKSVAVTPQRSSGDFNAVKKACRDNDAQACKTALLDWAQHHWPDDPPTSLGAIGTRVDVEFAGAIATLNRTLYAREGSQWQGEALWSAARRWLKAGQSEADTRSALAPLRLQ
ncbi:MAG: BatD family protein [Thiogranum sp.]|nr:BatD family protein [Thiogranum sp.]